VQVIGLHEIEVGGRMMLVYEGKLTVGLVLVHEITGRDAYARSVAESLTENVITWSLSILMAEGWPRI
jgi:hypothetical protein